MNVSTFHLLHQTLNALYNNDVCYTHSRGGPGEVGVWLNPWMEVTSITWLLQMHCMYAIHL